MTRYRYTGSTTVLLTDHARIVKPGDVIEVEGELNNANFEVVSDDNAYAPVSDDVEGETDAR